MMGACYVRDNRGVGKTLYKCIIAFNKTHMRQICLIKDACITYALLVPYMMVPFMKYADLE